MSDNMETEVQVDAPEQSEAQDQKTFTQAELDKIIADRVARVERKYEKKLSGIDLDEAQRLMQEKEQAELERQKERGEFEQVLKKTVEKKEQEIMTYKQKLEQTLVDGSILNAASKNNAVSPDQVSALLKGKVRLSESGNVEVLDENGAPRYSDSGDLLTVDQLVGEFLTANPHFVKASAGGTGSQGNAGGSTPKPQSVDDMLANWDNGGKEAYAKIMRAAKR